MTRAPEQATLAIVSAQLIPSNADERALVAELAELVLEQVAPEEIAVLPETADEYFRDPRSVLEPRRRDEAIGFGLDLALLTPYVLAVATPVVGVLAAIAQQTLQDASVRTIQRLLRRRGEPDTGPALSADQARRLRDSALEHARGVGLDEPRATLLADAIVGGLAVR